MVENGKPELLEGMRVNYDCFDTLGARMQLGRTPPPDEDRPDRRYEVILTHGLWMRRFGGDPHVLGRAIRMTDNSFTIVGVLSAGFRPLARTDGTIFPEFYLPLGYALGQRDACRSCQHLQLIGRLKAGVSVEQARQDLGSIMRDIVHEHPADYGKNAGVRITPLRDHMVDRATTAMWVLLGAVGLVLLMACANVANLVLARATVRAKGNGCAGGVRGRDGGALVRQLMLECLLLAAASGVAGFVLAWLATLRADRLRLTRTSADFRNQDGRASVVVHAWRQSAHGGDVWRDARAEALTKWTYDGVAQEDSGRGTDGRARLTLRSVLVAAELALAFVLVMGVGLLGKSFIRLTGVNPGYDAHNVLSFGVYAYGQRYQKPEAELNFYREVEDRLLAMPGVESVGMASVLPMGSFDRRGLHIQERPLANPADAPAADTYSASRITST